MFNSSLKRIQLVTPVLMFTVLLTSSLVLGQERMPPLPSEKMTDAQKKAAQEYKAPARPRRETQEGGCRSAPEMVVLRDEATHMSLWRPRYPWPG